MGEEYNVTSRNCQDFSARLIICMQAPRTLELVIVGIGRVPHRFAKRILKRRCEEWKYWSAEHGFAASLYTPKPLPTAFNLVFTNVARTGCIALIVPAVMVCVFSNRTWMLSFLTLLIGWLVAHARLDNIRVGSLTGQPGLKKDGPSRGQLLEEIIERIDQTDVEAVDFEHVLGEVLALSFV
jgi:hypothetical protein